MIYFLGLDLSLTCTGMAAIDSKGYLVETATIKTKASKGLVGRIGRFRHIAASVVSFVEAHSPCSILIEGYSFGSKGRSLFDIAEAGGIVKSALIGLNDHILLIDEVAPSSLQLQVTGFGGGRGKAKKEAMKRAVEEIYGPLGFKESDLYDATGLAILAFWRSHEKC